MKRVAIRFEDVSKIYILHHQRIQGLRDAFPHFLKRLAQRKPPPEAVNNEEFFALKDVSFEVEKGEVLGIIGRNGAGKTTILKMLSGITVPSRGTVVVDGAVAALIEIGAGFHGELTGRENVYLYGSIMGLKKRQISEKFNEIVAFAELEQFIDTPVKRYSSGMYVRLGFSVIAHINPEVLLVDEVLAVGDMAFRRKCMERIKQFRFEGKTIVLVSHNLIEIEYLCTRAIWLDGGKIRRDGTPKEVVGAYVDETNKKLMADQQKAVLHTGASQRWGSGEAVITEVIMTDKSGLPKDTFPYMSDICIKMRYKASQRIQKPTFGVGICTPDGIKICDSTTAISHCSPSCIEGEGSIECKIDKLPLLPGNYSLIVSIFDEQDVLPYDRWGNACYFQICTPGGVENKFTLSAGYGLISFPVQWNTNTEG